MKISATRVAIFYGGKITPKKMHEKKCIKIANSAKLLGLKT